MITQPSLPSEPPRVTVVMAVNRIDGYFGPAVQSVLQQTFPHFELLIMVDAACREQYQQIARMTGHDSRVRVIEAPSLGGLAFALNLGIAQAQGEYIARMDGDDLSHPQRLEEQVRFLEAHPEVTVLGCRVQLIDARSEKVNRRYPFFSSDREIRRVLPFRNPLPHPALMFRRSALFAVGGYKHGHSSEDHEMFIRMARDKTIRFHNLDQCLFDYRRHDAQGTRLGPRTRICFVEISGFLFSEFLRTHSPKYLFGMLIIHPGVRAARMQLRKWMHGATD